MNTNTTEDIIIKKDNIVSLDITLSPLADALFGQSPLGGPSDMAALGEKGFDVESEGERIKDCHFKLKSCGDNNDKDPQIPRVITPYDRSVFNAYSSCVKRGKTFITDKMIFETMTAQKNHNSSSSVAMANIDKSMRKMRQTLISFAWGKHRFTDEPLVPCAITEIIQRNGSMATAFVPEGTPALSKYSASSGNTVTVDRNALNINVNFTEKNIVIRDYIILCIMKMKTAQDGSNKAILMDRLYQSCQIGNDKQLRAKARNNVFKILDCLVKAGFISGYKRAVCGRSIVKILIDLPSRKNPQNKPARKESIQNKPIQDVPLHFGSLPDNSIIQNISKIKAELGDAEEWDAIMYEPGSSDREPAIWLMKKIPLSQL